MTRRFILYAVVLAACSDSTDPDPDNPLPALYELQPSAATAGAAGFTLMLRGEGFVPGSRVRWAGSDRPTVFVSDSILTASIQAMDLVAAASVPVTVFNPAPGGGSSGATIFAVQTSAPPPPVTTWNLTPITINGSAWDATISSSGVAYVSRINVDSISRIDVAGNSLLGTFKVGLWAYEAFFTSAGTTAFITNAVDHGVGVVNATNHVLQTTFPTSSQPIRVHLGPTNRLYVTQTDGNVLILNASTGAAAASPVAVGGVLNGIAMTPDSSRIWVGNTTGLLREINTATGAAERTITMGGTPQDMLISPDGTTMYVANEAGWLAVYRLSDLVRQDSIAVSNAFGLALNPAGTQLWVSRSGVGQITVISTASRTPLGVITTGGSPRHIAFAANGTALVANENNVVHIARQNP